MSKKLPDDYFRDLPGRIQSRIEAIDDNMAENAPLLASISKSGMYRVPEFYFTELAGRLSHQAQRTRNLKIYFRRVMVAASVLLIAGYFYTQNQSYPREQKMLAESEILDYYINHADELDAELLSIINEPQAGNSSLFENFEEEELEDYLNTVIDDLSLQDILSSEEL